MLMMIIYLILSYRWYGKRDCEKWPTGDDENVFQQTCGTYNNKPNTEEENRGLFWADELNGPGQSTSARWIN